MVTEICLCTSYDPLLGCAISWESCHAYFLYIICHSIAFILIDRHSQKWISTFLFELFFTWIKTHIFVPTFSISHICISIINIFCCFLILGHIFTWNIQPYTKLIQHHIYTTFEKIFSFSCFIFSHMRLQRVTLTTRKCVFIFSLSG